MSEGDGGGHGAVTSSDPRTLNRTLSVKEVMKTIGNNKENAKLLQILQDMDKNSDGTIDVPELVHVLRTVERTRRDRRHLLAALGAMLVFGLLLVGTIIGLTYAVVYAVKDTEVRGNVMFTKKSDGTAADIVRTASAEFGVQSDSLVSRLATQATDNSTLPVLRTAAFMGTPQALHSEIDVATLLELKYVMIKGTGKVELGLAVHGVARIPFEGSVYGTVVRIITTAGTVTLDGTIVTFSSAIADIFTEAGFRVSSTRRALLGSYNVLGFFSAVKVLSAAGLPSGQPGPKLPSDAFMMKIKVYEPCVILAQPGVDRCKYQPPKAPASVAATPPPPSPLGASPPMPPYDESAANVTQPPVAAGMPPSPPASANATANITAKANATANATAENATDIHHRMALEASIVDIYASMDAGRARTRLRHRHLATAAPIAVADDSGRKRVLTEEPELEDLAGVEEYMGVRYMTHNETTYTFGGAVRVVYDYALYPGFQKIDVTANDNATVYSWQKQVLSGSSNNTLGTYYCKNESSSPIGSGFNSSDILNYTYAGMDSIGDMLVRRFEMFVRQPNADAANSVMRIEYWDTPQTFTPVRLEFRPSDIGTIVIEFLEVRPINASSPEAVPELYVPPSPETCLTDTTVPALWSPFSVSGQVVAVADTVTTTAENSTSTARRLAQSYVMAREWESLDHVNGTGDWPQWALDLYGGVHPAHRRELLAERRKLDACGQWYPVPIYLGCPAIAQIYQTGDFAFSMTCPSNARIGPFSVGGSVTADRCKGVIQGCISLSYGLPKDNWLVQKIGIPVSITIARVCVGYNYFDEYVTLVGEFGPQLPLGIFSAIIGVELDFSACCVWVNYVKLEAKVGINVGIFSYSYTLGSVTFVSNSFIKGSFNEQWAIQNAVADNMVGGWISVHEGFWGDWRGQSFPCALVVPSANGATRQVAYPMNSYDLRIEGDRGGGDDTALNGISVGCLNGAGKAVNGANGYWGDWTAPATCPPGGYFVGAIVRIEQPQGGGDDTAANSIQFACSNKGYPLAHNGMWGSWSNWASCPTGTFICGLQIRIEADQGGGDDTALNGLRFACCSMPAPLNPTVSSNTTITTGTGTGYGSVLNIVNGNLAAGAYIEQNARDFLVSRPSQTFIISSTGLGLYTITSLNGLCLTVESGYGDPSSFFYPYNLALQLNRCQGLNTQMFAIVPQGNIQYSIATAGSSLMCLDVPGGTSANGWWPRFYWCHYGYNQLYSLDLPLLSTLGSIYTSMGSNQCWDVVNGATRVENTPIQQWPCTDNNPAQQFTIFAVGTNSYQIKTSAGYCLGIRDASTANMAPLVVQQCIRNAKHQTFRAGAGNAGGLSLSPFHNPTQCLDVSTSSDPGARLFQYPCHEDPWQSFRLQLPV